MFVNLGVPIIVLQRICDEIFSQFVVKRECKLKCVWVNDDVVIQILIDVCCGRKSRDFFSDEVIDIEPVIAHLIMISRWGIGITSIKNDM